MFKISLKPLKWLLWSAVVAALFLLLAFRFLPPTEKTSEHNIFYQKHQNSVISSDLDAKVEIAYVESGDQSKPAIIFVHGTPGGWGGYIKYLKNPQLQKRAHLISIDRPGWGNSKCATEVGEKCFFPELKKQSHYLGALIKKLDEQNQHLGVILVGHSLGAPLIGQMAFDYQQYIKGVIFIAAPFDPKLSKSRWYNWLSVIFTWIVPKELEMANDEMLPLSEQLEQMKDSWSSIKAPIWVIQGKNDGLVHPANIDFSKKVFKENDVQFLEVEKGNHFLIWNQLPLMLEIINRALDNLNSA